MDLYGFEEKLKAYIKAGGRTQAAVARKLGYAPDTFNKWVRGINKMPVNVIHEFSVLHGLDEEQRAELFNLAGYIVPPVVPKTNVKIYLHGDLASLTTNRRSAVIDSLAGLLKVPSRSIEVYSVYEGNVVLDLGLPFDAAQRLRVLLQANDPRLRLLEIEKITLAAGPKDTETWVLQDGAFGLVGQHLGAEIARLQVEDMVVERLEVPPPTRPTVPLRTRIPEPRAQRLVGRSDELDWLCQRLKAGGVAAIAGVRGIGGIGKTELAIAAARKLEGHFEGRVIWLDCGPNDAFSIQERLAAAVGAALQSDDLQVRADTLALALRQQPPTLVVLDDLRRRHLADFACIAPPRPPCALLATSRRYDLPLPRQAICPLDVLTPRQSLELLAAFLPAEWLAAEESAATDIAKLLEHIPLALTLAARRAERIAQRRDESGRRPLATLLGELRERRIQVLNQGRIPSVPT